MQDPIPYLHSLTSENYEIIEIFDKNHLIENPNNRHSTLHSLFYDKKINLYMQKQRKQKAIVKMNKLRLK